MEGFSDEELKEIEGLVRQKSKAIEWILEKKTPEDPAEVQKLRGRLSVQYAILRKIGEQKAVAQAQEIMDEAKRVK